MVEGCGNPTRLSQVWIRATIELQTLHGVPASALELTWSCLCIDRSSVPHSRVLLCVTVRPKKANISSTHHAEKPMAHALVDLSSFTLFENKNVRGMITKVRRSTIARFTAPRLILPCDFFLGRRILRAATILIAMVRNQSSTRQKLGASSSC